MKKEEIVESLKTILHEGTRGRIKPESITEHSDLIAEQGLDSIEALDILLRAEEKFGITIDDEDLNKELFKSISSFADYVLERVNIISTEG
ncbi:acyl carrier protein [Ohtaekwangia sp.]|uniref:acyl carrier protein n=1 Tax=Ohtaekwangia sp. TaxID=2066019 RepID=UPI002FDD3E6C